jgi:hypothetical protein
VAAVVPANMVIMKVAEGLGTVILTSATTMMTAIPIIVIGVVSK